MQEPSFLEEDMTKEQIGFESLCTFFFSSVGYWFAFFFRTYRDMWWRGEIG
jgi:hypothetical protein